MLPVLKHPAQPAWRGHFLIAVTATLMPATNTTTPTTGPGRNSTAKSMPPNTSRRNSPAPPSMTTTPTRTSRLRPGLGLLRRYGLLALRRTIALLADTSPLPDAILRPSDDGPHTTGPRHVSLCSPPPEGLKSGCPSYHEKRQPLARDAESRHPAGRLQRGLQRGVIWDSPFQLTARSPGPRWFVDNAMSMAPGCQSPLQGPAIATLDVRIVHWSPRHPP